ncbi:ATP-binding protein [Candidatus Daviesbacteria bacterium]|nr:ATP-binding protein [Candidatus Daviesbacteria bacterium]
MSQKGRIKKFKPCIVAFAGPPLSGKSTLGGILSEKTNFKYFDIDEARWKIFPRSGRLPNFLEDLAMLASYTFNHHQAAKALLKGIPVAVGATYSRTIYVNLLRNFAHSAQVPLKIFVMDVSEKIVEERIKKRVDEGNSSVIKSIEAAIEVKARFNPITGGEVTRINTGLSPEENLDQILKNLAPLKRS